MEKNKVFLILFLILFAGAIILVNDEGRVSDCQIAALKYDSTYEIPESRLVYIDVVVSNFGDRECEITQIWSSEFWNSELKEGGTSAKLIPEEPIIQPKETKTYTLIGYIWDTDYSDAKTNKGLSYWGTTRPFEVIVDFKNQAPRQSIKSGVISTLYRN